MKSVKLLNDSTIVNQMKLIAIFTFLVSSASSAFLLSWWAHMGYEMMGSNHDEY